MEPIKDHLQPKVTDGEQKLILDERVTGETDELDPGFTDQDEQYDKETITTEPGDDPISKLI